jgi:hypothetical protein
MQTMIASDCYCGHIPSTFQCQVTRRIVKSQIEPPARSRSYLRFCPAAYAPVASTTEQLLPLEHHDIRLLAAGKVHRDGQGLQIG